MERPDGRSSSRVKVATADAERARLRYESNIGGVNTTVAKTTAELEQSKAALKQTLAISESTKAQLELQRYYLDNTLMVAPEDGRIVNLQVQPGMVAGIYRIGGIAAFIVDNDRYLLASYTQETLKYVKVGQPVEFAWTFTPVRSFRRKWTASGGQTEKDNTCRAMKFRSSIRPHPISRKDYLQ